MTQAIFSSVGLLDGLEYIAREHSRYVDVIGTVACGRPPWMVSLLPMWKTRMDGKPMNRLNCCSRTFKVLRLGNFQFEDSHLEKAHGRVPHMYALHIIESGLLLSRARRTSQEDVMLV